MRALHVLSALDPRYGGPSYALLGLVRAQRAAGIAASITATHYWPLPSWPELERLGNEACRLQLFHYQPRHTGSIGPFADQLRDDVQKADVVHIHSLWHAEQLLAAKFAVQYNKPYLFRPCGMLAPWSMAQGAWKKRLYIRFRLGRFLKSAAGIHYTTHREQHTSLKVCNADNSIVEPNGIDCEEFARLPEPGSFRQQHSIGQPTAIVMFFGRVHPKKGLELLLQAFQLTENAVLVIAGPDNDGYAATLKAKASELGIMERVLFVGPLYGPDRLAALQDATVFVLPSFHENFGNSVIESLACGTPVIISDQVDLCEDLTDTRICQVVPLNVQAITTALNARLQQPRTAESYQLCRAFAYERFDWLNIGRRWVNHYQQVALSHVV